MVIGFWKRGLSDLIDIIILSIFGFLVSFIFKPLVLSLGEDGFWIGLVIIFSYTVILQSYIGQGQSLGKKILRIQVLRTNGSYLSLSRSFIRFFVVAFVCYNGLIFRPFYYLMPFLNNLQFMLIIFILVGIVSLGISVFLALHPLKKGFQDILADSIVVAKGSYSKEKLKELDSPEKVKRAYKIWGLCCVVFIIYFYVAVYKLSPVSTLNDLTKLEKIVASERIFSNVGVSESTNKYKERSRQLEMTKTLVINGFLKKTPGSGDSFGLEEAKKCAKIVSSYSIANSINYVVIKVRTGFNIGIASSYITYSYPFSRTGEYIGKLK